MRGLFFPYTLCWTFHLSLKFLFCQTELIISYDAKRTRVEEVNRKSCNISSKRQVSEVRLQELQELQLWVCVRTRDVIYLVIFVTHQHLEKWIIPQVIFFSRTSWVSKSANATWAADWLNPACKHFIYIHSHVRHTNVRNILKSSMRHWIIFKFVLSDKVDGAKLIFFPSFDLVVQRKK